MGGWVELGEHYPGYSLRPLFLFASVDLPPPKAGGQELFVGSRDWVPSRRSPSLGGSSREAKPKPAAPRTWSSDVSPLPCAPCSHDNASYEAGKRPQDSL